MSHSQGRSRLGSPFACSFSTSRIFDGGQQTVLLSVEVEAVKNGAGRSAGIDDVDVPLRCTVALQCLGSDIVLQDGHLVFCAQIGNSIFGPGHVDHNPLGVTQFFTVVVDDGLQLRSLRMTMRSGRLRKVDHQHIAQELIARPFATVCTGIRVDIDQREVGNDLRGYSTIIGCLTTVGVGRPETEHGHKQQKPHVLLIEQHRSIGDCLSVTRSLLGTHVSGVYNWARVPPMTVFLLLSIACSDYEVRAVAAPDETNWFEEASDRYRDNLIADETESDTGGNVADGEGAAEPPHDPLVGDCGLGQDADNGTTEDGVDGPDSLHDDAEGGGSDWGDLDPEEGDTGFASDPGIVPGWARGPGPGEVIVSELMIHPLATDDAVGEWVELRNVGSVWMDLGSHRLSDRGVDDVEILPVFPGSLFVPPGGYLTICAHGDYWTNGGVACDGTYRYWTMGGGFALANVADEVQLLMPDGLLIDEVRYGEGFSTEGEAKGVPASVISSVANDDEDSWCEQRTWMALGDAGTPGADNDPCW